jgi:hypothetical protein
MDNVIYQHRGNIEKLNKHDTIKIIHSKKNWVSMDSTQNFFEMVVGGRVGGLLD